MLERTRKPLDTYIPYCKNQTPSTTSQTKFQKSCHLFGWDSQGGITSQSEETVGPTSGPIPRRNAIRNSERSSAVLKTKDGKYVDFDMLGDISTY